MNLQRLNQIGCQLVGGMVMIALSAWVSAQSVQAGETKTEGLKIVFLGDSITQQGAGPNGYVTIAAKQLKKLSGETPLEVLGKGISGNRVPDLQKRLERDVLAHNPTHVVIYIGINDVWHTIRDRGTSKEDFEKGLREIIGKIQKGGASVILCTPTVINEKTDGTNDLDKLLEEYSAISRTVAKETKSEMLDLRVAFIEELKKLNKENATKGNLTYDGVHLNQAGNDFLAKLMVEKLDEVASISGKKTTGKAMLKHVVLFKFKEDATAEKIQGVVKAFGNLQHEIKEIKGYEWGTDVSVENKAAGFTHAFIVTFADAAGRDIYLPHPAHKKFVMLVGPVLEDVLVFDFYQGK